MRARVDREHYKVATARWPDRVKGVFGGGFTNRHASEVTEETAQSTLEFFFYSVLSHPLRFGLVRMLLHFLQANAIDEARIIPHLDHVFKGTVARVDDVPVAPILGDAARGHAWRGNGARILRLQITRRQMPATINTAVAQKAIVCRKRTARRIAQSPGKMSRPLYAGSFASEPVSFR